MPSRPKWMSSLGNTANPLFLVDSSQRIQLWNRATEKLLGYSEAEVLGRACHEVFCGKLRSGGSCCLDCSVQRQVRRGVLPHDFSARATAKDGRTFWVNVSIIALWRRGKPLTVHLLHPLSQRERSDEAMNRILRTLSLYGLTKPTDGTGKAHDSAAPDSGSPASALSRLTRRELEVLELLTRGLPPQAVAEKLCVSPLTVRSHVRSLLAKLGVHSKTEAVALALRGDLR